MRGKLDQRFTEHQALHYPVKHKVYNRIISNDNHAIIIKVDYVYSDKEKTKIYVLSRDTYHVKDKHPNVNACVFLHDGNPRNDPNQVNRTC